MPLQISDRVRALGAQAQDALSEQFARIDAIAEYNTQKVLSAFQTHKVAESMFQGTTGYGYDDLGRECGASLGNNRALYQGLFLAPHTVAQATKTAVFAAKVMELLGYRTDPMSQEIRHDIIQMIHLETPEAVERFCHGIQSGAPVDSYVTPVPWDMPGYDCPVIMAAGAFIQGASIELSADAPMRPPYTVYLQGGLTYESGKLGILLAADALLRK